MHCVDDRLALRALVQRLNACRATWGSMNIAANSATRGYALEISTGGGVKWLTSTLKQSIRQAGQADTWAASQVSDQLLSVRHTAYSPGTRSSCIAHRQYLRCAPRSSCRTPEGAGRGRVSQLCALQAAPWDEGQHTLLRSASCLSRSIKDTWWATASTVACREKPVSHQ